jgi:hypothetical protein
MPLADLGRMIAVLGGALLVTGLALMAWGHVAGGFRLPGTLVIERENVTCIVPIVGMIIVSVLLTIVLNVLLRILNRGG